MKKDTIYTTQDEIRFLEGISDRRKPVTLKRYIESASQRADWGKINMAYVIDYANFLLTELKQTN